MIHLSLACFCKIQDRDTHGKAILFLNLAVSTLFTSLQRFEGWRQGVALKGSLLQGKEVNEMRAEPGENSRWRQITDLSKL